MRVEMRQLLQVLVAVGADQEATPHDPEVCFRCYQRKVFAQVADEMLRAEGDFGDDVLVRHFSEVGRRIMESKFFKLIEEEKMAGRDPAEAFKERGWTIY